MLKLHQISGSRIVAPHHCLMQAAWLTACMMGPGKAVLGARISATLLQTRSMSSSLIIPPGQLPGPSASVLVFILAEGPNAGLLHH